MVVGATVDLPCCPSTDYYYYYTREQSSSTAEVGPWGEALADRVLSAECEASWVEDTIWGWDDEPAFDANQAQDKGPTLSVVDAESSTTAVTVDLASQQSVTLHFSTSPFVPDGSGGAGSWARRSHRPGCLSRGGPAGTG